MMKKSKIFLTLAIATSLSVIVGYLAADRGPLKKVDVVIPESISDYRLSKSRRSQWALPKVLREVSGIAVVDNEKLFIHHDEAAVVFEFNVDTQVVMQRFQLADPVLKIDLEGIALLDNDVYLTTSTGEIYKVTDGLNRTGVIDDYEIFDTGLSGVCEIEGLDEDYTVGSLVLVCKQMLDQEAEYISVYRYSPDTHETTRLFDIPFAAFGKRLHATAIARQFDSYIVLFGKEKLLGQLSREGLVLGVKELKKNHHAQSEGLGFLEDGRLVLADEGKKTSGRITIYSL